MAEMYLISTDIMKSDETLFKGLREMERQDGPRPTPRVDYDVVTGLPNHRATPERSARIMLELAAKEEKVAGDTNNAPWYGARDGCWDSADALRFPEPNTLPI